MKHIKLFEEYRFFPFDSNRDDYEIVPPKEGDYPPYYKNKLIRRGKDKNEPFFNGPKSRYKEERRKKRSNDLQELNNRVKEDIVKELGLNSLEDLKIGGIIPNIWSGYFKNTLEFSWIDWDVNRDIPNSITWFKDENDFVVTWDFRNSEGVKKYKSDNIVDCLEWIRNKIDERKNVLRRKFRGE